MAAGARKRGIIAEINVTPLVDIMLVLLIVFMLTANLIKKQKAIEVELPRASQGTPVKPTELAIMLKRDGTIFLNDQPVTPAALRVAVAEAVAKDKKTQAIISGDQSVSYGRVVWVLDLVKSLNVTTFAIQIDPTIVVAPPT